MKRTILCSVLILALIAAPMTAFAANAAYILKVYAPNTKAANVHNNGGEKIGSLRTGTTVLYWGKNRNGGQMLKVMGATGDTGYVYKGNLKTYGAMNLKQVYVTKGKTDVYRRSGSAMKKAGSVGKGVPVIVYGMRGKWAYVRNLYGTAAYVKMSSLKKLK